MIVCSDRDREQYIRELCSLEKYAECSRRGNKVKSRFRRLKHKCRISTPGNMGIRLRRKLTGRRDSKMTNIPYGDLALDTGTPDARASLYFSNTEAAVYTALFGSYDSVPEPVFTPGNISYYIITDQEVPATSKWSRIEPEGVLPEEVRGDAVMSNRWCKMHPHLLFPDFTYSVYCDANLHIISDMTPVTAGLEQYPVAMFRHKKRDCVYDEIDACILQKKDSKQSLRTHGKRLNAKGIPDHWGLLEAPVIARKHNDISCIEIMDTWWELFCTGSRRDQLSLIETLWTLGIRPETIGTLGADVSKCRLFIMEEHRSAGRKKR